MILSSLDPFAELHLNVALVIQVLYSAYLYGPETYSKYIDSWSRAYRLLLHAQLTFYKNSKNKKNEA